MSCVEHIIENAIYAIGRNQTYEEWVKTEPNKDYVKSDLKEIWEMAMYVYWADFTRRSDIEQNSRFMSVLEVNYGRNKQL